MGNETDRAPNLSSKPVRRQRDAAWPPPDSKESASGKVTTCTTGPLGCPSVTTTTGWKRTSCFLGVTDASPDAISPRQIPGWRGKWPDRITLPRRSSLRMAGLRLPPAEEVARRPFGRGEGVQPGAETVADVVDAGGGVHHLLGGGHVEHRRHPGPKGP